MTLGYILLNLFIVRQWLEIHTIKTSSRIILLSDWSWHQKLYICTYVRTYVNLRQTHPHTTSKQTFVALPYGASTNEMSLLGLMRHYSSLYGASRQLIHLVFDFTVDINIHYLKVCRCRNMNIFLSFYTYTHIIFTYMRFDLKIHFNLNTLALIWR